MARLRVHPEGELPAPTPQAEGPLAVDTHRRRFHVDWVRKCPLRFSSPDAPALADLLGTVVLAILAGQRRYAHVTGLRTDTVNPQGLGMAKVCSEDSVRRAFKNVDPEACARWQQEALAATWLPALQLPWVLDLDVTVKPIYGHQEGAAGQATCGHPQPARPVAGVGAVAAGPAALTGVRGLRLRQ
ncbi:MAG: transposase [Verrucomicrobiae bacterium]|jgi:hypothetical protein|nr:transposase [Verrucomicrobiae bacterium]